MARRILGEYEEEYLKLLNFVDRFPDLQETPAQFQERCAQAALARFWQDQQRAALPRTSADAGKNGTGIRACEEVVEVG
jgi:hypothetical protein